MEFVRDDLRPRMLHFLSRDKFISEAMSTSVVNKKIMAHFIRRFPRNVYRRVALNPINPKNAANAFEHRYIARFNGDSDNRMIGHLKESQEEIRSSEAKYRQIFEGSKDGIIVTDCELEYFIPTMLFVGIMLNKTALLEMVLSFVEYLFVAIAKLVSRINRRVSDLIDRTTSQEFVFFTKGDNMTIVQKCAGILNMSNLRAPSVLVLSRSSQENGMCR